MMNTVTQKQTMMTLNKGYDVTRVAIMHPTSRFKCQIYNMPCRIGKKWIFSKQYNPTTVFLKEGSDVPQIDLLIDHRIRSNDRNFDQMPGRTLGKNDAVQSTQTTMRREGSNVPQLDTTIMVCINVGSIIPIYQPHDRPLESNHMCKSKL